MWSFFNARRLILTFSCWHHKRSVLNVELTLALSGANTPDVRDVYDARHDLSSNQRTMGWRLDVWWSTDTLLFCSCSSCFVYQSAMWVGNFFRTATAFHYHLFSIALGGSETKPEEKSCGDHIFPHLFIISVLFFCWYHFFSNCKAPINLSRNISFVLVPWSSSTRTVLGRYAS